MIDLTNTKINQIQVIERDRSKPSGSGKKCYWICICPICNKKFSIRADHLVKDGQSSCKECSRKEKLEDLTNKKYGKLLVNSMIYEKNKRTKCSCTCDCGSTNIIVQANHLKAGEIQSCGCLISNGEEKIIQILKQNNIAFERQKTFKDCKNKNTLRFDFYLPSFNLIIEYNGIQHYKPVEFFGGQERLEYTQKLDNIKKQYCLTNNINYLLISYKDDIIDLLKKNNII